VFSFKESEERSDGENMDEKNGSRLKNFNLKSRACGIVTKKK
jgi:hypothetical protein